MVVTKENICREYADDKELDNFVKAEVKKLSVQLASYKKPTSVFVSREALPKTTTRKVKRKEVLELVNA